VRQRREWAAVIVSAAAGALCWLVTTGAGVASAAPAAFGTGAGLGAARAQLVGRIASPTGPSTTSAGLPLGGADIMAGIVALLAVLAFLFLVVTFVRRRVLA